MKLSLEQIQFIDSYLENSEIIHVDTRSEMVDHVASGIEAKIEEGDSRDFYYIFKDYMVKHKSRLLDNNKQFIKSSDKKLLRLILKELVKWPCIVTFLALVALFKYLNFTTEIALAKSWLGSLPLALSIISGLVYFIALRFYKLNRFSSLERLGFIFAVSFQLFHFCWNIFNLESIKKYDYLIIILVSLTLSLLLAMALVSIKQIKYYNLRFKILDSI
ncbi:hypothetical protein [uncultured Winogradskyella sp.]|uniref:hypothetical protein n=1 Tax=uncultured Winogradskyella sp. TaxID=395353 RepID=UPI002639B463|nr:hypothetical protein [uncultured Winogradskyella sp.]